MLKIFDKWNQNENERVVKAHEMGIKKYVLNTTWKLLIIMATLEAARLFIEKYLETRQGQENYIRTVVLDIAIALFLVVISWSINEKKYERIENKNNKN